MMTNSAHPMPNEPAVRAYSATGIAAGGGGGGWTGWKEGRGHGGEWGRWGRIPEGASVGLSQLLRKTGKIQNQFQEIR